VSPVILIAPASAPSFARSLELTTEIELPESTVNSFTINAFETMEAKFVVIVLAPEVSWEVIFEVAIHVVAPAAALPCELVKQRCTVHVLLPESVTEERRPSFPSVVAVLSPENHKTAIFPASMF
jgi:hypothetical protein